MITEEQALEKLKALCDSCGGVSNFANMVGVDVSAVSHQLNRDRPIQGKVAKFMGIKVRKTTTISYVKEEG